MHDSGAAASTSRTTGQDISSAQKNKRVEYVDVAKAIAIFLVVLGHPRPVEDYGSLEQFLYAFHMPLFFMLSGIFLKQKNHYDVQTWLGFLKKNLLGLFVPYIVWAAIYMPFSYVNLSKVLYGSWAVLRNTETLSSLWFLPVLFLARTYLEAMMHLSWKFHWDARKVAIVCTLLFFVVGMVIPHNNGEDGIGMPWGFDIAFVAAAFMLLGYLGKPYLEKLAALNNWIKLAIAGGSFLILLIGIHFADYSETHPFMLMANAEFGSPVLCVVNGIIGSLSVIMIAQIIGGFFHNKNWAFYGWILLIGANTMGIYLIHKPFLQGLYDYTINVAPDAPYFLRAIVLAIIAIAFSVLLIAVLSKYIAEILGRPATSTDYEKKLIE